jgi:hypothetical protein
MVKLQTVGEAGLTGWREPVAKKGAEVLSRRTPLGQEQIRAIFGIAFLALAVLYVARALARLAGETRS